MRKIKLDIEDLVVASFVTTETQAGGGTVAGREGTLCSVCGNDGSLSAYNCTQCASNATCAGQHTCDFTCDPYDRENTCADTCGISCDQTCGCTITQQSGVDFSCDTCYRATC